MKSVRDRSSSPEPVLSLEELRVYHSLENLIEQPSTNLNSYDGTHCTLISLEVKTSTEQIKHFTKSPCAIVTSTPPTRKRSFENSAHSTTCNSSSCTIVPPTPTNEQNFESPLQSNSLNSSICTIIPPTPENKPKYESSFLDSDADSEYLPPALDYGRIELEREDSPCSSNIITKKRLLLPECSEQNVTKAKHQRRMELTDKFGVTCTKLEVDVGFSDKCEQPSNNLNSYGTQYSLISPEDTNSPEQIKHFCSIRSPDTTIMATPLTPKCTFKNSENITICNSSSCTIVPPTPTNEQNCGSPLQSNSLNSSICTIIPPTPDNEPNFESSFLDSDADPEYLPPALDNNQIELEREDSPCSSKIITRKRLSHPKSWKQNVRKAKYQSGEEYTDKFGVTRKQREVKLGCGDNCPYSCNDSFGHEERNNIFENFWRLNSRSKGEFFSKMVYRTFIERKRTKNLNSRRKHTYHYHFLKSGKQIKVCQVFFTKTLDINKTRIHYYFENLVDDKTATSKSPAKGRHTKYKLPNDQINGVVSHINSFTTIESHYCRSTSNKKYLQPNLSLRKMYDLYCSEYDDPVKFWAYKDIFNKQFNLAFFVPKKDLCNKCEEYKTKEQNEVIISPEEESEFTAHVQNKLRAKEEKDFDKTNNEVNTRVLVIDLQNVFALPKANVNCFYYKRKLLCFNLTGYCKDNKTTYCSIWNETAQGRGANELASAYEKILHAVIIDFPQTKKIIIWSDSCVAQNRNSILSLCLLKFLNEIQSVVSIEQKYSEPGHSLLQEVDAVHSTLERYLKNKEIYSPIGLIRLLSNAKFPKVVLRVMQMKNTDFWNYSLAAQKFYFSCIPYTKIKHIKYESHNLTNIAFKRSFNDDFAIESIHKPTSARRTRKSNETGTTEISFDVTLCQKDYGRINEEKRKDLMSLLKFMPKNDQQFFNAIIQ